MNIQKLRKESAANSLARYQKAESTINWLNNNTKIKDGVMKPKGFLLRIVWPILKPILEYILLSLLKDANEFLKDKIDELFQR